MKASHLRLILSCHLGICAIAIAQAPTPAATLIQYSDADKKKIAEIEQRPEVKELIEAAWDEQRLADLRFIYAVNSSVHLNSAYGLESTQFRGSYWVLYNNPMLQRYVNNIGQRLVPSDSPNNFAFKIILNPVPIAESYSTGTVLVSTGLISMLDNEAQLAYVLAHEIAHVERNHHYDLVRMPIIEEQLNKEKQESAEKKRTWLAAATTLASAGIGAAANGGRGAAYGAAFGLIGGVVAGKFIVHDHTSHIQWSDIYENEADQAAIGYMLQLPQPYDVREAPKLYARLESAASKDQRIGLGFIAKPSRMRARDAKIQELLNGSLKPSIDAKLKAAGLTGSSGDFNLMMAALKRDNGIEALNTDLFAMARDNLEEAVSLRSNDSQAQLYLGKVISITARTPQDQQEAEQHFLKAIQYDEQRGALALPHLEHALHLMGEKGDKAEIRKEVEAYVALYQREHTGGLPPNILILYDYLTIEGDPAWYVPPAEVVSTKNVDAIRVNTNGAPTGLKASEVIAAATGSGGTSAVPVEAAGMEPKAKAVPVATRKPKQP